MYVCIPSRGGVLPENLGRGLRPASHNPYPIYDQNLRFSLPYLWPDQKLDTLFMTWLFLLLVEEGKAWMGEEGHDEEVASSKRKTELRIECKNRYPIYDQIGGKMARIDTQFMTKTAEKPYPLGPHIPI